MMRHSRDRGATTSHLSDRPKNAESCILDDRVDHISATLMESVMHSASAMPSASRDLGSNVASTFAFDLQYVSFESPHL
jgi:hypothetical protein